MNVLVTGSTGLIGSAVVSFLKGGGHQIRCVRRVGPANRVDAGSWDPDSGRMSDDSVAGVDAVIHLCGAGIANRRWSAARKRRLRSSRIDSTRLLSETIARASSPPRVLVCASAIGFYGSRGDERLTEMAAQGDGFLADLCHEWEAAAEPARVDGLRVVHLRIGIVLSSAGGALRMMLPAFKAGVGGVLGSGEQYMSWVALDDLLEIILAALTDEGMKGPVNAVAPGALTNREFTKTLGRVLRRPTIVPVPGFAIRTLFGEMGKEILLASTRVEPTVLTERGFINSYPILEGALRHVLRRA